MKHVERTVMVAAEGVGSFNERHPSIKIPETEIHLAFKEDGTCDISFDGDPAQDLPTAEDWNLFANDALDLLRIEEAKV